MSILDEFADWFIHEVAWEDRSGTDAYGDPAYLPSVTLKCRVSYQQKLVLDQTGQQRVSTITIHLQVAQGVEIGDRITLPAGMFPSQPRLLTVSRQYDDTSTLVERLYA